MNILGTICYTYIQGRKKLHTKCEKVIFKGYYESCLSIPETKTVRKVRCVKFTENFEMTTVCGNSSG